LPAIWRWSFTTDGAAGFCYRSSALIEEIAMLRILIVAAALLPTAVSAASSDDARPDKGIGKGCIDNNGARSIATSQDQGGFHRLDQLPPANEQLTVLRSVDGCQKPVIVRYGIGGAAK
jgi:hypothetical protein